MHGDAALKKLEERKQERAAKAKAASKQQAAANAKAVARAEAVNERAAIKQWEKQQLQKASPEDKQRLKTLQRAITGADVEVRLIKEQLTTLRNKLSVLKGQVEAGKPVPPTVSARIEKNEKRIAEALQALNTEQTKFNQARQAIKAARSEIARKIGGAPPGQAKAAAAPVGKPAAAPASNPTPAAGPATRFVAQSGASANSSSSTTKPPAATTAAAPVASANSSSSASPKPKPAAGSRSDDALSALNAAVSKSAKQNSASSAENSESASPCLLYTSPSPRD